MPLGSFLGREPRKSVGLVLIAGLCNRGAEHVADSTHGANQWGTVGTIVKFLPESRDQRVDRAIEICPLAPTQHPEEGSARQGLARMAQKRHQEVELRRGQVNPLPSGTYEVSRRLIEAPARERVKPLDRLDGLGAANVALAPPWRAIGFSQLRLILFKNMDLHRAPPLITALRIVTVKLIRNGTCIVVNELRYVRRIFILFEPGAVFRESREALNYNSVLRCLFEY